MSHAYEVVKEMNLNTDHSGSGYRIAEDRSKEMISEGQKKDRISAHIEEIIRSLNKAVAAFHRRHISDGIGL